MNAYYHQILTDKPGKMSYLDRYKKWGEERGLVIFLIFSVVDDGYASLES